MFEKRSKGGPRTLAQENCGGEKQTREYHVNGLLLNDELYIAADVLFITVRRS